MRLCVDYRGLNKVTIKNRYPLLLINEMLDRFAEAAIFTKLDLKDAYHRIRIRAGDEWKTAFRTRYGLFEYLVMPFGLANAPATFQAHIHRALAGLVDSICVVYIDDILIYSQNHEQHVRDVRAVLERLQSWGLYAKLSKCRFHVREVDFLGFVVTPAGITMDQTRVTTIIEWPTLTCPRDVQVLLGFANFYRRLIAGYSSIIAPLHELVKPIQPKSRRARIVDASSTNKALDQSDSSSTREPTGPWWNPQAEKSFNELKSAFSNVGVIGHFIPALPLMLVTDASRFALGGILLQPSPHSKGPDLV